MQLSLNLMTILRASLDEAVKAAVVASFEWVELWFDSLERYLATHAVEDLRSLLDTHHIRVLSIGDIESVTFCNPLQFEQVLGQCRRLAAVARAISCSTLIVSASVRPRGIHDSEIISETASVLGKLLDIAEPEGVGIALAFRGFGWCAVNSLELAQEAIAFHAGRRIGLALDTFDLHNTGAQPATLEQLEPSQIFVVRLADCADVPRALLTETARVLPGEGVADLDALLDALSKVGFSGPLSLKVLNPRLWERDAAEIAKTVMMVGSKYTQAARSDVKH